MKIYLFGALAAALVFASGAVFFFTEWQSEKNQRVTLEKKVAAAEGTIEALNQNHEEELSAAGEKFITNLFTYEPNQVHNASADALKQTIGAAKDKLLGTDSEGKMETFEEYQYDISSEINIKGSTYNKTAADQAQVTIMYEQTTEVEGMIATTVNEIVLKMQYVEGEWKVKDYSIAQLV